MDILSLCVYAILAVILLLIVYRAYNYHFTENFTSKTPTSSNLSKNQKNVISKQSCPKPPPCATCPIPPPCPSCPPHEPCPTCPIPDPCPSCPPPISENKFSLEDYMLIRKLGNERLKKVLMDHFEKIGLIKLFNDYKRNLNIEIIGGDNEKIMYNFITQGITGKIRKIYYEIPIIYDENTSCFIDIQNSKYGCVKIDSF